MITTDAIYNTLIASGSYEESVTGTLKDGSGATVLNISNEYIKTGSLIIDNKCINNDDLEPGAVYAAELKITITGNAGLTSSQKSSLQNGSLNLTYTITDGNSSSSISIGIYYIIEVTLKDEDVEIIAEDMMSRLSKNIPTAVREDLNFVARTPYELLDLCCQNCSTSRRPISLANDETEFDGWSNADVSFLIPVTADIATYRDLVAEVAKIMGCFATIDKNTNGLILKRLDPHSNSNVWTLNEDIRYRTEKSGYICKFGKVSLGNVSYPTTSDDDVSGLILSMRATELTDDSELLPGIVQNLYNEMAGISYRPCKIDFMGNIALEVGDWIGVNYTEDGTTYTFRTIITHLNWILNGKELIESTGSSAATTKKVGSKGSGESRNSSSIDNLTNRIETLESSSGSNKIYTSTTAPNETLGKEGDLWVKYIVDYNDKFINSHGDEVDVNLPRYESADDAYNYVDLTIRPEIRSICNLATTAINAFVKGFEGEISIAAYQYNSAGGHNITASQFSQLTTDTYTINNQSFNVSDGAGFIGWSSNPAYYRYIGVTDYGYRRPVTNIDDFNDNLSNDGTEITVIYYYLYYNTSNKKIEYIQGSISHNNINHSYWNDKLNKYTSDVTIDLINTSFTTIDKIYCKIDDDWVSYDGDGGSEVVVNQILQSGTEIAQISVDGEVVSIYAPNSGNKIYTSTADPDETAGNEGDMWVKYETQEPIEILDWVTFKSFSFTTDDIKVLETSSQRWLFTLFLAVTMQSSYSGKLLRAVPMGQPGYRNYGISFNMIEQGNMSELGSGGFISPNDFNIDDYIGTRLGISLSNAENYDWSAGGKKPVGSIWKASDKPPWHDGNPIIRTYWDYYSYYPANPKLKFTIDGGNGVVKFHVLDIAQDWGDFMGPTAYIYPYRQGSTFGFAVCSRVQYIEPKYDDIIKLIPTDNIIDYGDVIATLTAPNKIKNEHVKIEDKWTERGDSETSVEYTPASDRYTNSYGALTVNGKTVDIAGPPILPPPTIQPEYTEGTLIATYYASDPIFGPVEVPIYAPASSKIISHTTAEWESLGATTVSESGVLYVYTDYKQDESGKNIPGFKMGDGNAYVADLPFSSAMFDMHMNNTDIHITAAEREKWNNKVSVLMNEPNNNLFFITG